MEGDNSPLPAMLRDWVKQGANILRAMTKEELDELVAAADKTVAGTEAASVASAVAAYKAANADDVKKAEGTELAGETLTKAAVEEMVKAAVGPVADERDTLKAALAERDDAITKMAGRIDTAADAITKLTARLEEIESTPVRKTAGSGLASVSKSADAAGHGADDPAAPSGDDIVKMLAAMSPEQRAELAMKAALRNGREIGVAS
jgi:hypothetical protein